MSPRYARLKAALVTVLVAGVAVVPFDSTPSDRTTDALSRLVDPQGAKPKETALPPLPADPAWQNPNVKVPASAVVDVEVPSTGSVRAGTLPLKISRPAKGTAPSKVTVRMLGQDEAKAKEARGLAFEVKRADGGKDEAAVDVELDYSGIATMYGGNFASRLRLSRLGTCAADPCAPVAVPGTENDVEKRTLRGTVPVRGTAPGSSYTTFGASSGASGSAGNYSATPLKASDSWNVSLGSGAFTYAYDMAVPPPISGAAPKVGLTYNSQAVDGRTVADNGQPSIVGEGWGTEDLYIERKFSSCSNGKDLCWSANNEYHLHFGTVSGEIVKLPNTNEWRVRGQDPAFRIRSFTGGNNGDNDDEYFVLFTPDGTKYWFGYGIEPRNAATTYTHSVFNVPVYGGSGEPCYNATAANSWCQQAWRWNVDRVLDTNDNVMTYFYTKEYNYYSRGGLPTQTTVYTRGGYLYWIEYSQRNNDEDAQHPAKVSFYTSDRCSALTSCPAPTAANAASYPDVPLDQQCSGSPCLASQDTPTFWTTKKLDSVTTRVLTSGGTYTNVATYSMTYEFPATGDGTSPSLWLHDIKKTGEIGSSSIDLPTVRTYGTRLANRVNTGVGVPAMNKWRVSSLDTELGGRVTVTYDNPNPCPTAPSYPNWYDNDYHCFPAWYTPPTGTGAWIAFHKYVVTQMVTEDMRGPSPTRTTTYSYLDTPAWHYKDSLLATQQSWDDYRGHASVKVVTNSDGPTARNEARYLIFRGMNGDKLNSTTSKTYTLTDTSGTTFTDHHYLRGLTLDVKRYDSSGTQLSSLMTRYWADATIDGPDGWQSHNTQYVKPSKTVDRVKDTTTTSSWRDHVIEHTYDTSTSALVETTDNGQTAGSGDDTCTKYFVTDNIVNGAAGGDTMWIVDAVYKKQKYAGVCGSGSTTRLEQTDSYYDGATTLGTAPTRKRITKLVDYSSATETATTTSTYDSYGRVTAVVSPTENAPGGLGRSMTTAYSPTTGFPYNGVTTTNVLGHTVKNEYDFGTGGIVKTTDANGKVTTTGIDALGRTVSVHRPEDASGVPGFLFDYSIGYGGPSKVKTSKLVSGTTYSVSYAYLDGFGRLVEQQEPPVDGGTGRRVKVTRYDSHGNISAESSFFGATGAPGTSLVNPALTAIPQETRYGYDAMGRKYVATQYALGTSKWTSRTDYYGLYQQVDSPVRTDAEHYKDVFGRTTKIVEHPAAGGTITTQYTYNAAGDLATITDDAGNVTSYTYDWKHRRLTSDDADQGTVTTTYDEGGRVKTVTDDAGGLLTHVYDAIGRPKDLYAGSTSGTLLAHWDYDSTTVANSKGLLTEAIRYDNGNAYRSKILGYDGRGRITSRRYTIPTVETGLAGDYDYAYAYDQMNRETSVTLPAAGGLAQETVTTTYDVAGSAKTMTSALDDYVTATVYDADGRLASRTLKSGTSTIERTYQYDASAGRLQRLQASRGTTPIEDLTFQYDAENNITAIADAMAGVNGTSQRECFRYEDGLNRLTHAFTAGAACTGTTVPDHTFGPSPYDLQFTYDDTTRLTSVTDNVPTTPVTTSYTYSATGHFHAPSAVGGSSFGYNLNGAQTSRTIGGVTSALTWTPEHMLASVTPSGGSATTFVYDTENTRLLRRTPTQKTLYLDRMELTSTSGGTPVATRYYGSTHVRTPSAVTVVLHNHQKSSSVAVDSSGNVTRQRYLPFGGQRGGAASMPTDRGFLDTPLDPTGLQATGARYYDPAVGAFISPDPLIAPTAPRSLSPYVYAQGNPTSKSDPSGLMPEPMNEGPKPDGDPPNSDPQPEPTAPQDNETQFVVAKAFIKAGVMVPDSVNQHFKFSKEQILALRDVFLSSPCAGDGHRWTCRGNTTLVNACVMQGQGNCEALQKSVYQGAENLRSKTLEMMQKGIIIGELNEFISGLAETLPSTPYEQYSETVLGKYVKYSKTSYNSVAQIRGSRYFELPNWDELTPREREDANRAFLKETADLGSVVYLSHSGFTATGSFQMEVEAMRFEHGYTITADGHWLLPPAPANPFY